MPYIFFLFFLLCACLQPAYATQNYRPLPVEPTTTHKPLSAAKQHYKRSFSRLAIVSFGVVVLTILLFWWLQPLMLATLLLLLLLATSGFVCAWIALTEMRIGTRGKWLAIVSLVVGILLVVGLLAFLWISLRSALGF